MTWIACLLLALFAFPPPPAHGQDSRVQIQANGVVQGATRILNCTGTLGCTVSGGVGILAGGAGEGGMLADPGSDGVIKRVGPGITLPAVPGLDFVLPAGNVATATAFATNGGNCALGEAAAGVTATGVGEGCFDVIIPAELSAFVPATAAALANDPNDCGAGSFPLGIDASGAVVNCTPAATQAEFDAFAALLTAAGTINTPSNPIDWSQLKNVPGGFADGTDDGGTGSGGGESLQETADIGRSVSNAVDLASAVCLGGLTNKHCFYGNDTEGAVQAVTPAQHVNLLVPDTFTLAVRDATQTAIITWEENTKQTVLGGGLELPPVTAELDGGWIGRAGSIHAFGLTADNRVLLSAPNASGGLFDWITGGTLTSPRLMTLTRDGVLTLNPTGSAATPAVDFSNAGSARVCRAAASATPTTNNDCAYDTASHAVKWGVNGVTQTVAFLTSNVATATALAANPAPCGSNQFVTDISNTGTLTCASLSDTDVPNDVTAGSLSGPTTDCPAGQAAAGITATGDAAGCFVPPGGPGGAGTPAGTHGQLQYNSSNNFAGMTGSSVVGADLTMTGNFTAGTITSSSTTEGELTLTEAPAGGSDFFRWRAPSARSTSLTAVLPIADPSAGQVMVYGTPTSGVSTMTWMTPLTTASSATKTAYWDAGGMSTDGSFCDTPTEQILNSGIKLWTFSCAQSGSSVFYGSAVMPDSYSGGAVTFELNLFHPTTETITFAGSFSAQCRAAGTTINAVWGTAVATNVAITTGNQLVNTTSAPVSPNGSCAGGDFFTWRYVVNAGSFSPPAANTRVIGVKMEYPISIYSD